MIQSDLYELGDYYQIRQDPALCGWLPNLGLDSKFFSILEDFEN